MSTVVKKKSNGVVIATVIALTVLVSLCVYVLTINSNISISDDTMVYIVIYGAIAGFALLAFIGNKKGMLEPMTEEQRKMQEEFWEDSHNHWEELESRTAWNTSPANPASIYYDELTENND